MPKLIPLSVFVFFAAHTLHAQWVPQKSGTTTALADVVALDSTTAIAVGRDGSILKTTDSGQTWIILPLAPLFFHPWNAASFSSPFEGAVTGDFGRVATTFDGGVSWFWHVVPGGRTCHCVLHIAPGNIYVGDDSGWVHRSVDTGQTWASEHISAWPIRSLFAWTGPSVGGLPLYALTPLSLCMKTEFPPSQWQETLLQAFQGLGSEALRGVFSSGGGSGYIVGVQGDLRAAPAIVRKSPSDSVWRTIPTGLQGDGILFGVSAPSERNIYVCGDRGMLFQSSDGGDTWVSASAPTAQRLRAISFSDPGRGFAVGDSGTIIYTSNGGTTSVEGDRADLPNRPSLSQNYPNPFNPDTRIKYQIENVRFVNLTVYDVLGREVATLVNGVESPGTHTVIWDAAGFASGVYYVRLRTGSFVESRRMLHVK